MRSVGEGAATGVFALGFASGVTGARMVGVEGVLWRRALTVGRDVEGEGWGRRDISREDSTMGHGGLRWRINQRNRMLDLVNSTVPSALAPIMEVGVGPRGAPQVPAGGLLFHVARRAPMLVHNSGCPETPYRSRSDFKTNRKALPPLHANVSAIFRSFCLFGWYCEGLGEIGDQDGVGLADGRSDDGAWIWKLQQDGILTIHSPAGESATPVSQ